MQNNKATLIIIVVLALLVVVGMMFLGPAPENETIGEEAVTETETNQIEETDTSNTSTTVPEADTLTVSYTNEGFSPYLLEVNAGDTVTFVNNSNQTLWVTSSLHPTATDQHYPEFDMDRSIASGESWEFQFTLLGTWGYKNLNNENHLGAIVVIPQNQQ